MAIMGIPKIIVQNSTFEYNMQIRCVPFRINVSCRILQLNHLKSTSIDRCNPIIIIYYSLLLARPYAITLCLKVGGGGGGGGGEGALMRKLTLAGVTLPVHNSVFAYTGLHILITCYMSIANWLSMTGLV